MIDSLDTILLEELKDLYDLEKRLSKALPKLMNKSTTPKLKSAFRKHHRETLRHVRRLEQAFKVLGKPARGKACAGIQGILKEGDEHIGERYSDPGLRDAVIIGAAQRAEHYEIAAYGTAIAHARLLGHDQVVMLLEDSLGEEKGADDKLTEIAVGIVNKRAAQS